jgi:catechol 2,3-dioxygenase-like lactoylglutathione lyase family enzyme
VTVDFLAATQGDAAASGPGATALKRTVRCAGAGHTTEEGRTMQPRIKLITLGVDDLEKSLAFYRDGLGLPTQGIIGTEFADGAVVFFQMNDDLILALYPRAALANEAKLPVSRPSPSAFAIGHIVRSKHAVNALMRQAERAGARITDPARDRFWGGYSGYFQDVDGHLWEIAWNPAWEVGA